MESAAQTQQMHIEVSIILGGIRAALAKFPHIKDSLKAEKIDQNIATVPTVKPRIYYRATPNYESAQTKAKRVKRELIDAGVTWYGLIKSESRYLPKIIHNNERIEAVIYGQHNSSSAMMIATDERIIYLDKKPMVEMFDEVSYEVVSGLEFDIHTLFGTVVLHTPVKNYEFRLVNLHCAEKFARHIEDVRLEREQNGKESTINNTSNSAGHLKAGNKELEDMAGYYWLPTDEEERRKIIQ